MSPAAEVILVASREVKKNLRSAKGLVLLLLSVMGGALTAVVMTYAARAAQSQAAAQGLPIGEIPTPQLISMFGLVRILGVTVWLTPLLVALLGFDGISGELQHRSVRYWTVRARRASFYAGKVLGLWAVVALVTLFMDALVWVVFIASMGTPGEVLKTGPLLWLVSLPIALAWSAIASLVSSMFRSPILALLVTFAVFFALWIVWFAGALSQTPALQLAYPNSYKDWMIEGDAAHVVGAIAILLGAGGALTAAGALGFARRDV
jgi:ABC-type transport system involved in multi-copper enzyme maturation permease subunit